MIIRIEHEIERLLLIRSPHIENILSGKKTWEMRSRPTKIRGWIGLAKAGSGKIYGAARLVDSLPEIHPDNRRAYQHKHCVEDLSLLEKWRFPWVLENAYAFEYPIPYEHPQGAVTWVSV